MAFDQANGPSTPGRGFASASRPSDVLYFRQQRTSSSGNSTSFAGFGSSGNLARSSSMRNIPTTQSSMTSTFGFGGMRETSATPKTVRWEDAPSTPIHEQQIASIYPQTFPSQQGFSLTQQQSVQNVSHFQTPSYQPSIQSSTNPRLASSQQPYTSLGSSSSLQLQKTPPRQQYSPFSNSFSSPNSNVTADKPHESASTKVQHQMPSVLNRVAPRSSQSLSHGTQSQQAPSNASRSSSNLKPEQMASAVIVSRPALLSRIKWNALVMISVWLAPRFSLVGRAYWILLDLSFALFGGDTDVHVAMILSWLRKASTVILLINMLEAAIMLNTQARTTSISPVAEAVTKRKPSLACPPNRIVSSTQPSSSPTPSVSKRNTPRQYAHNSPLRESIFRASASAQRLGEEKRLPSETFRLSTSSRKGSSASPLAAFLARKQERIASGGDVGDMSFDGEADLSTDSIEVDRALRAFSADYEREVSLSRSLQGSEGQQRAIAV